MTVLENVMSKVAHFKSVELYVTNAIKKKLTLTVLG